MPKKYVTPELYGYGDKNEYGIRYGDKNYRYLPEANKFETPVPDFEGMPKTPDEAMAMLDPSSFYLQGKEGRRVTPYKEDWELEKELEEEKRLARHQAMEGQQEPDIYKESRDLIKQRVAGLWSHTFPGKPYGSKLNKNEANWWRGNLSQLEQNTEAEVKGHYREYKSPEERAEKQKRIRLLDYQLKKAERDLQPKEEKELSRIEAEAEARAKGTQNVKTTKSEMTETKALQRISAIQTAINRIESTGGMDEGIFALLAKFSPDLAKKVQGAPKEDVVSILNNEKQYILDKFVSEDTKKTYGYGGKTGETAGQQGKETVTDYINRKLERK